MHNQNVVIALTTRDNDYQAEQSASATEVASRLGVKINVIYADNNAVNQCQQLVKIIQDRAQRPDAILVEPVGTPMYQVAKAAVAAGIAWGILNREADYIPELRRAAPVPVFAVSPDQEEVGRIQGKQLAAFTAEGNILYIEGPSTSSAANLRTKGMLSTKPSKVGTRRASGSQVMVVVEHVQSASHSGRCLPERCHGYGRKRSIRQPAQGGPRAIAEHSVYGLRRSHEDGSGMGTQRTVAGDGSDSPHGGPRSRNAGQSGQQRFNACRAHIMRTSIFSGHRRDIRVDSFERERSAIDFGIR